MTSTPPTYADLTYMVAVELKSVREGVTTAASISEIIDTDFRDENDDFWNTGPAWILDTPSGNAPQGEYEQVTDYASGTVTLQNSLTATIPQGTTYAVGRRRYPLDILKQAVNAAYRDLGTIPNTDESLTTATQTTEYTIPSGVQRDLREVWLETITTMDNKRGWVRIPHGVWYQEDNLLYLPQLPIDRTLKLVYVDDSPELYDYDDTISEFVHSKRIVYKGAVHALMWRSERLNPAAQDHVNQRINYFLDLDLRAQNDHPIHLPKKRGKMMTLTSWLGKVRSEDSFTVPGPP